MAWAEMPLDVILEIASFLDLHDSIHLLVVSLFVTRRMYEHLTHGRHAHALNRYCL
jgi:hypothetical protein